MDPLGNRYDGGYDTAGNPVARTNPSVRFPRGLTTRAAASWRTSIRSGTSFSIGYDAANRVVSSTDPLGHTATQCLRFGWPQVG